MNPAVYRRRLKLSTPYPRSKTPTYSLTWDCKAQYLGRLFRAGFPFSDPAIAIQFVFTGRLLP